MQKVLPQIQVEVDSPLLLNFKKSESNLPESTNSIQQKGKAKDTNGLHQSEKAKEPNVDILNALSLIKSNLDGIKAKVEETENFEQKSSF